MTEADWQGIRADVLARLLLVQSTAGHLPDDQTIVSFVCRGLESVPGVAKAWCATIVPPGESEGESDDNACEGSRHGEMRRFPLRFGGTAGEEVLLKLTDPTQFVAYAPHVQNLLFVVAVMLEERRQRRLTEAHQHELEMRVEERTRQLTAEIEERKTVENQALAEKQRAEDYLEITQAIILELDAAGKILLINKRGSELLGYPAEALVGHDWFELAIPPHLRCEMRDLFRRLLSGEGELLEYYDSAILAGNGEFRHIAWHNVIRYDAGRALGTLSSGVDITERKRSEEALAAEKDQLAVTLRSIGDGVITTDVAGRVAAMNPVAEQLTGWAQRDAAGRSFSEIFSIIDEHTQAPGDCPVKRVLDSKSVVELSNHTQLIARDGARRSIADSAAPIRDSAGNVIGVVLVFRDVTEKQRLLEQMQHAERLDAVGILAGGIAHDFNNLLSGIFGYVGLAREQATADESHVDALDEALKVFGQARELTQQLLTFSKGGTPVRSVVDLRKLLTDCTRFSLSGSNVAYQLELSSDVPSIEADANQIWRTIDNLVRNAVQAMPEGGSIVVSCDCVELPEDRFKALSSGRYVRITVADNGPGIPLEALPRIFDPFFTTKEHGTGLGLATAYSVIKKHDGHIEVESQPGRGCAFRIYLPANRQRVAEVTALALGGPHVGSGRALVMDDEPYLRRLFVKFLERMGYQAEAVEDGEAAIAAVERAKAESLPFTVALIDLTVPGKMGGKEAISRIRACCPDLIALASSGYSDDPVMSHPQDFGFTASIGKPFTISDLDSVLEVWTPKSS